MIKRKLIYFYVAEEWTHFIESVVDLFRPALRFIARNRMEKCGTMARK